MRLMRLSLLARSIAHPAIQFGSRHALAQRARLGLGRSTVVYHRPRHGLRPAPTIGALRSQTSRFRFPSVGRIGRVRARRATPSLGLPRARRA
jgi:hypothetical protein